MHTSAMQRTTPLWSADDIPWDRFDPALADAGTVRLIKAASLVEHNAASYGRYLHSIFRDDPDFRGAIDRWVLEEEQHGAVLRRWAQLADPSFDGEAALARFSATVRVPEEARESVRGSMLGELVARCTVEVGTTTFYSALRDSVREPVLHAICTRIAGDEGRHYKLFLDHARRYQGSRSRFEMLRVALKRIADTGDDELAYAWFAAGDDAAYLRRRDAAGFLTASLSRYRSEHIERASQLVAQAAGYKKQGWIARIGGALGWRALRRRVRRAEAELANAA